MEALCCSGKSAAAETVVALAMAEVAAVEAALYAGKSILGLLMGISCLTSGSHSFIEGKELIHVLHKRSKSETVPENKDRSDSEEDDEDGDEDAGDQDGGADEDDVSGDEGNEEDDEGDEDPKANGAAGSEDEDEEDGDDEDDDEAGEDEDEDAEEEEEEEEEEDIPQPPAKKRK